MLLVKLASVLVSLERPEAQAIISALRSIQEGLESTVRYLGIEVDDALHIAEQIAL